MLNCPAFLLSHLGTTYLHLAVAPVVGGPLRVSDLALNTESLAAFCLVLKSVMRVIGTEEEGHVFLGH